MSHPRNAVSSHINGAVIELSQRVIKRQKGGDVLADNQSYFQAVLHGSEAEAYKALNLYHVQKNWEPELFIVESSFKALYKLQEEYCCNRSATFNSRVVSARSASVVSFDLVAVICSSYTQITLADSSAN